MTTSKCITYHLNLLASATIRQLANSLPVRIHSPRRRVARTSPELGEIHTPIERVGVSLQLVLLIEIRVGSQMTCPLTPPAQHFSWIRGFVRKLPSYTDATTIHSWLGSSVRACIPDLMPLSFAKPSFLQTKAANDVHAKNCVSVSYRLQILRLTIKCLLLFSSKVLYPALSDHTREKPGYIVNFTIGQI